jgi:hypothetical protein
VISTLRHRSAAAAEISFRDQFEPGPVNMIGFDAPFRCWSLCESVLEHAPGNAHQALYSPAPMPNPTAARSWFHLASGGKTKEHERPEMSSITPCPRMGKIAGLSLALLLATGMSAVVPAALPVNPQDSVRSLYDTLLSRMKDDGRLGQSGRYARLAPTEYIVSADSSCLMHLRGCAERIGVPIKFIHIAQILNGAAE